MAIPSILFTGISAQNDTIHQTKPQLSISGFLDVFYVYDFNPIQGKTRQPFLYNHNRAQEFNVNLGFIKLGLEHLKYRAGIALQAGTYVNDNYANEPTGLKNLFEAFGGISLNSKNNLWLDAGIFSSHIGFESAISIENATLTRSLLAENSPYFLSGVKLTFNPNPQWEITGLVLNGWQRIQPVQGNSLPSLGFKLNYNCSNQLMFNWSSFWGTDDPDTSRRIRYFNNFYGVFQIGPKFGLTTGFDVGIQQRGKGESNYNIWYSPVIIAQYAINKAWNSAMRIEFIRTNQKLLFRPIHPRDSKQQEFLLT